MSEFIVSDDQARTLMEAVGPMTVRDQKGSVVGIVVPTHRPYTESAFTDEEISEAVQLAKTSRTWHSTAEVLARLRSLDN